MDAAGTRRRSARRACGCGCASECRLRAHGYGLGRPSGRQGGAVSARSRPRQTRGRPPPPPSPPLTASRRPEKRPSLDVRLRGAGRREVSGAGRQIAESQRRHHISPRLRPSHADQTHRTRVSSRARVCVETRVRRAPVTPPPCCAPGAARTSARSCSRRRARLPDIRRGPRGAPQPAELRRRTHRAPLAGRPPLAQPRPPLSRHPRRWTRTSPAASARTLLWPSGRRRRRRTC